MTRGIWGDPERYLETYWRRFPGVWTHGDWASVDEDGYWFLHGRSDDTLNIAGKRIGPAELESAAVEPSGGRRGGGDRGPARGEGRGCVALLRARARCRGDGGGDLRGRRAPSSARRSRPIGSSSSRRCRRPAARRSCAAPFARARSGMIPATCRRSRTPKPWRRSHVPADQLEGVALVTGGGRGIGASIARELTDAGMQVAVTGRTAEQVERRRRRDRRARADRRRRERGRRRAAGSTTTERELGPIELLVANAGMRSRGRGDLGACRWTIGGACRRSTCSACISATRSVIPLMLERGRGRIVITGSGSAYLPGTQSHGLRDQQGRRLPLRRDACQRAGRPHPRLPLQPGSRPDGDDGHASATTLPWTPPELAPQLVRVLASGRADALAGRYIHAEHDDIEDLIARADEIAADDLNAIRLRR